MWNVTSLRMTISCSEKSNQCGKELPFWLTLMCCSGEVGGEYSAKCIPMCFHKNICSPWIKDWKQEKCKSETRKVHFSLSSVAAWLLRSCQLLNANWRWLTRIAPILHLFCSHFAPFVRIFHPFCKHFALAQHLLALQTAPLYITV